MKQDKAIRIISASSIPTVPLRIIKIATCPTCSGKTNLTYHLGSTEENQAYIRIVENSGGGFFCEEWVALKDILAALDKAPHPITAVPFIDLFVGKSVNTPGFLLAVLKHEGLVKLLGGKVRGYEKLPTETFMAEVNKLVASDVDLKYVPATPIKKSATTLLPKKSKQASLPKSTLL